METKKFIITDFGAIPNVDAPQTEAIQSALDACFLAGGGEVVVPANMRFVTGDIRIRSNTTLHLMENSTLEGSKNPNDYLHIHDDKLEPLPEEQNTRLLWDYNREILRQGDYFKAYLYTAGSHWNYAIIRAVYAENIAVIGEMGARIDGRNPYDPDGEENYRGPHGINMHFCKGVTFRGYTIEQAGNWAHAIFQSEDITFEDLTVFAGHDALHTRSCSKVLMQNCKLITGDDCVAGFDNLDVVIRNCEISTACSAFRYGGNNILVENCNVWGPCPYQFRGSFTKEEKIAGVSTSSKGRNNTLSFWTNFVTDDLPCRKPAGKVVIRNCTVKNADRMLHLNLSGNEPWQRGTPPTDILFENIKIEGVKLGLTAYGIAECPMEITLRNVDYTYASDAADTPMFRVAHLSALNLENVTVKGFEGDTLIRAWSDGITVNTDNLSCNLNGKELITRADEEFVCKRI